MFFTHEGQEFHCGWMRDPAITAQIMRELSDAGHNPIFATVARHLLAEDDNADVFFWTLEAQILGQLLKEWDQGQIGDCVGNGGARTQQNTLLAAIAAKQETDDGVPEQWPGAEACVEYAYGTSREEDGNLGGEDGSTGAGMAKASINDGILICGVYGSLNLTRYSVATAKKFGYGVPQELHSVGKRHPVKTVAMTQTGADVWAALGAWKPVCICGNISRTMKRQPGGFCPQTGNDWPHCQALIGRCTVRSSASTWPYHGAGEQAVVYENSWGAYLGELNNTVHLATGQDVHLPRGSMYLSLLSEIESDLRQQDTFAYSRAHGWPADKLNVVI